MKIALERSSEKIYDRIVLELAAGFESFGHTCTLINISDFVNLQEVINLYNEHDMALITNSIGFLSIKRENDYIFEIIQPNLVFLHHDAPFSSADFGMISAKIEAFKRVKHRSSHLTIEQSDLIDFQLMNIPIQITPHISTMGNNVPLNKYSTFKSEISFLGHVVPPADGMINFGTSNDLDYYKSYLRRTIDFNHSVKNDFDSLFKSNDRGKGDEYFVRKFQYIQYVNTYTMFLRGALINSIEKHRIDIIGGDPAWLHGEDQTRFLKGNNVNYHSPIFAIDRVADIFSSSRINLNITSLQFDSAVINRVIDCALSGGFILTDRKNQLFELTSVAEEISFSNTDEMLSKISKYSNPSNEKSTLEILNHLKSDLSKNCSTQITITKIIDAAMSI